MEAKSERLQNKYKLQYREVDRAVKRMARRDKREYVNNLANQAEVAANRGEQGKVYKITKIVCGRYRRITDKQGQIISSEAEIKARWAEHFSEVLNRPPPTVELEIQEPETDLDVDTAPPKEAEIISAIRSLKKGKAPGQDKLSAELFKLHPELAAKLLQPLLTTIWEGRRIPDEWTKGVIVKIPKKGALSNCNNWRGITLLSVPSKILVKVIMQKISDAVDKQLRKEQAGFRKGRGCAEQIFTLRNIIEQCTEWQRKLYINFVDFEKAFDSIHRDIL